MSRCRTCARCVGAPEVSHASRVTIVSNKLPAGALQFIEDKQAEKDVEKLAKLRTKREKRLLEKRANSVA